MEGLDDAVERQVRTAVGDDGIIITYDEETSAWSRIACLG